MRAGIAPVTLLMLCVANTLGGEMPARWRVAAVLMLLVGVVTPAQELWRQTGGGSRWPDDGRNSRRGALSAAADPHPWRIGG